MELETAANRRQDMNCMGGHEVERRQDDRRQGERRVFAERRRNSVSHARSDDMMFRSGRRQGDRRNSDRRHGTA